MAELSDFQCFGAAHIRGLIRRGSLLGEGTFATAYLTSAGDRAVCLKIFLQKEGLRYMTKEAKVLTALSGVPRVPELIGVGVKPVSLIISFGGNTLKDEQRRNSISETQAVDIGLQVAETLLRMHERGWAHNDLKLDNIVVQRRGDLYFVTVIDLGNASPFGKHVYSRVRYGHIKYPHLAPELLRGEKVTSKSDVYSFGFVLKSLIPRSGFDEEDEISTLISQTMKYDLQARISMESAVQALRNIHFNLFVNIIIDLLTPLKL